MSIPIYKTAIPQTHDLAVSPAICYHVPFKTDNHNLSGSDGTATARVEFAFFSYNVADVVQAVEKLRRNIDGTVNSVWGDGTTIIMSCHQVHTADEDSPPRAGSDQWVYRTIAEYSIRYRVTVPNTVTGISSFAGGQLFEQGLIARLRSLPTLTDLVGNAIYRTGIPEMHDLGTFGPALCYSIPGNAYGHILEGSDGTATASLQFDAMDYTVAAPKLILEAIRVGIDGTIGQFWGDGSVQIMSCLQTSDIDEDMPPRAGSDQWIYRSLSEYQVKYRVALPTT